MTAGCGIPAPGNGYSAAHSARELPEAGIFPAGQSQFSQQGSEFCVRPLRSHQPQVFQHRAARQQTVLLEYHGDPLRRKPGDAAALGGKTAAEQPGAGWSCRIPRAPAGRCGCRPAARDRARKRPVSHRRRRKDFGSQASRSPPLGSGSRNRTTRSMAADSRIITMVQANSPGISR